MRSRVILVTLALGACGQAPSSSLRQCRTDMRAVVGLEANPHKTYGARLSAECRALTEKNSGAWNLRLVIRADRPSTGKVERLSFPPAHDLPLDDVDFTAGSTAKDFTFTEAGWALPLDNLNDVTIVVKMPPGADVASLPLETYIVMTLPNE